ncbi:MAG: hypothetical protein KGP28_05080 [Bdellovibrionales bacterium]|nr:hypothetical protein [Bdellovibrionales bacterium]
MKKILKISTIFAFGMLLIATNSFALEKRSKRKPKGKPEVLAPYTGPGAELYQQYPKEMRVLRYAVSNSREVQSNKFSKQFQNALFNSYVAQADRILNTRDYRSLSPRDREEAQFSKSALEKLELEEDRVDELSDRVRGHLTRLESRVFRIRRRVSLELISWQSEATLVGPFENTGLLTTNLGFCPGFGVSYENRFWALSADFNGIYGTGGVSAVQGLVTYQQSNVPAFGAKMAFGAAKVVASSGSELGIRGSVLFIKQNLTEPPTSGYSIEQDKALTATLSLFSRWRLGRYYFQTDFGRHIGRSATIYSFGLGYIL